MTTASYTFLARCYIGNHTYFSFHHIESQMIRVCFIISEAKYDYLTKVVYIMSAFPKQLFPLNKWHTCWYFEILQITCFTAVFIQWFCIHWWSLPESIILLRFSNELFLKLCQSFFFLLFLLPSFPHHSLSLKCYTSIHFYFYFFLWFYLGSPSI